MYEITSIAEQPPPNLVPTSDSRFLHPNLLPFANRHNVQLTEQNVIDTIDVQIRRHERVFTALMFEFEMEKLAMKSGAEATLTLKFEAMDVIRPILLKYSAIPLEDVLYVFESPSDALAAALAAKQTIALFNKRKQQQHKDVLGISGFGLHTGKIIFVEGTDIHWGDPVNTSSKLGQDVAENGIILISKIVKEGIEQETLARNAAAAGGGGGDLVSPFQKQKSGGEGEGGVVDLKFTPQIVTVSKVDLECYSVVASGEILVPLEMKTTTKVVKTRTNDDQSKDGQSKNDPSTKVATKKTIMLNRIIDLAQDVAPPPTSSIIANTDAFKEMSDTAVSECNQSTSTSVTPANTPATPNIPWLKSALSPATTVSTTSSTGADSRAAATAAYSSVPMISYDNGWSAAQKKQISKTFGSQDSPATGAAGATRSNTRQRPQSRGASGARGINSTRRRRPVVKERESVLTQKRKAMSLANDVLQDLEIDEIKKQAKERKLQKKRWHTRLISTSLYGSPKLKRAINQNSSLMNKRPGSPSKGSVKPRRPASSSSGRRRRQQQRPQQAQRQQRQQRSTKKHNAHPNKSTQHNGSGSGNNNLDETIGSSEMPMLNEELFSKFLHSKRNDILRNDAGIEASLKMKGTISTCMNEYNVLTLHTCCEINFCFLLSK